MVFYDYYIDLPTELTAISPLSFLFVGFVFAVFCFSRIGRGFLRPVVLLAADCLFLYSFSLYHLIALVLLAFVTYLFGMIAGRLKKGWVTGLAVIPYVALLVLYKYGGLFDIHWLMPLGFSFVSFKAMSYLADVASEKAEAALNPIWVLNYILFFPAVTAGPIHRYQPFKDIISKPQPFEYMEAKNGAFEMFLGIFEKMVFCDFVAGVAAKCLSPEQSGQMVIFGMILYSFQIYLDFDGYSHIAIGCARALGFSFPRNFRSPYLAVSIKDFWRRWHISLGAWFRDYVYIPLGGNRKGKLKQALFIMIVFLLSGLWHGSALNFAVWGLAHGALQVIEGLLPDRRRGKPKLILRWILRLVNFAFVTILWQFFRNDTFAGFTDVLTRAMTCSAFHMEHIDLTRNEWVWLGVVLAVTAVYDLWHDQRDALQDYARLPFLFRWLGYAVLVAVFLVFGVYGSGVDAADFIYQFF